MRSVFDNILARVSLRPVSLGTGTVNGASVDTQGYNSASVVLETGAISGTPTLDVRVQDSADGITFADIVPAVVFTQVVAANQSQVRRLEGLNSNIRRFVRVVAVVGGATPSIVCGASFLLGRAFRAGSAVNP